MITWTTDIENGYARIQLFENEVLIGWILPPHRPADTTQTAEWAGRWFYIRELPRRVMSFRTDHPESGLSASLLFKIWGRSATITTNVGGKLLLRRPKFWSSEYTLWDGKDQIFNIDLEKCEVTFPNAELLSSIRHQLYVILVIHALVTFGYRTSHA